MAQANFSKIYKSLEKDRYFSTIWCTLDLSVIPYLQKTLKPVQKYCDWLSTFGSWETDAKYLPHISLRYLGFTDELNKERLLADRERFSQAITNAKVTEIELGRIGIWEQKIDKKITVARLNWDILNLAPLKRIHSQLLEIPGYQFFESLEGEKYNPHISLGQINLEDDNYAKVKNYLVNQPFKTQNVKLDKFAINYASKEFREEFKL